MELSPVKTTLRIALVGDFNPDVIAHRAIPLAIDDAAAVLDLTADYDWLATPELTSPNFGRVRCHLAGTGKPV